jgi:hypothetical protein
VGTGVTATVNPGATLELAGTQSAFSDGTNDVDIINNSLSTLLVTGTNQTVGTISGEGNMVVAAGADITVTSIVQNELSLGNGALVVIRPSSATGAGEMASDCGVASQVPEPGTLLLMAVSGVCLVAFAWRRPRARNSKAPGARH